MAGTAAGIAKARAARVAKREQAELDRLNDARRARGEPVRDSAGNEIEITPAALQQAGEAFEIYGLAGIVDDSVDMAASGSEFVPADVLENQTLAQRLIAEAAPEAAAVLINTMRSARAAPNVRLSAARSVLDLAKVGKQSAQSPPNSQQLQALFEAIKHATELRQRRAQAIDITSGPTVP